MVKQTKVLTKRRKFIDVEIPLLHSNIELIGDSIKEIENKTIKLDLTRQLKGKSLEGDFKIIIKESKAIAQPFKLKLMPYFIRRMIRKRISYVEDSFTTPSQENLFLIKPFLITRKRVSRVVRKTLRNKCRNWLEDYISQKTNEELFTEILANRMQKSLSLVLKKTYPLSLCEIRILELGRPLTSGEIPKLKPKIQDEKTAETKSLIELTEQEEKEKIKEAEAEIKKTQKKAAKKQKIIEEKTEDETSEITKRGKEETTEKNKDKESLKEKKKSKKTDKKEEEKQ